MPSREYPEDIFDQFINLINIKGDQQKLLLKCYVISLFFPDIPKPIQMLYGEQGAAKTSEQEAIKDLVDPSPIPTSTFPRDINELVQKLMHNYVCFLTIYHLYLRGFRTNYVGLLLEVVLQSENCIATIMI